jgi:cytosine/adenosine deaminase-related metal-dependent hydrolase
MVLPIMSASERIGCDAGLLAMPALANAHDHGRGLRTLAHGTADAPLELWLPELARQPRLDPYLNAALAFARMATGGICATNHCHNTQDSARLLEEATAVSRAAATSAFGWHSLSRSRTAIPMSTAIWTSCWRACRRPTDRP